MEKSEKLSDKLNMALEFVKVEIPSHISENLSKDLRVYQIEALKHYLLQRQNPSTNHLLFNMATGSGKTLIMAALMLDLYEKGYRNFVFFVNSKAILEKTLANFCDSKSSKYLFKQSIVINSKRVEVKSVRNFIQSDENAINIAFNTIQGLHSLFTNERENSLTFKDLENHKIVFIADEAHHLNADTKNAKLSKQEKELKEGWESTIKKAFESNEENLLLEFSATIPNHAEVLEKYKNKIVFEYNLKNFCKEGYSKRIFLVKYEDNDLKTRFLGACLLSVYRQLLAQKHGIFLKPVVLFKSEKKDLSWNNQEKFNLMLGNLQGADIGEFYKNIDLTNELFLNSLNFFKQEFEDYENKLVEFIKTSFKVNFQLNANDDKEAEQNQIRLNSLEDKDNEIRAIFAVDKLNEGWDVLNLFDIVRLNAKSRIIKATTTKEAQLIGRGARYYPFGEEEFKFVRKYDKTERFNELSMLERLSYHSLNDVAYINALSKDLSEQGMLFNETKELITLKPSKRAKKLTDENKIFYVKNKRRVLEKCENLWAKRDGVVRELLGLEVPYFSKEIAEKEEKFEAQKEQEASKRNFAFGEKLCFEVVAKAMNMLKISMREIQSLSPEIQSKKEFYTSFLRNLKLNFDKRQSFDRQNQLQIAKFILQNFKTALTKEQKRNYEVSDFEACELKDVGERSIFVAKDRVQDSKYEWLYYTKWSKDSGYELDFLKFIDTRRGSIDAKFEEWIILRNDGFSEFKIYDNRKDEPTYAMGFEPDFIFFGKRKGEKNAHLSVECIMESKGEHLMDDEKGQGKDQWKENLLKTLHQRQFDIKLNEKIEVLALPFYSVKEKVKFETEFRKIFENSLFKEG